MADPVPSATPAAPQTTPWGQKAIGSEGWSPLDLLPVKWVWDAAVGAMTPQYEVPKDVGNVDYAPPQRDYLGDVEAANAQQNQARQNQMGIAELIAARARGEGPSIAEMQLRQSTDRLQNQQAGLIASQRGMNPALQRRLILGQAAQGQQAMNAQAAMLRAQEQQAAQALAAQTYGSMRGQDQSAYGTGAQANQGQSAINAGIATSNAQAEWNRFEAERQKEIARANANAGLLSGVTSAVMTAAGAPGGGGGFGSPAGTGVIGGGSIAGNQSSGTNTIQKWWNDPQYYQGTGITAAGYNTGSNTNTIKKPDGFAEGGVVPGYAQGGDSPKNDTVPAWLSPGEAVVPRSIMQAPDAPDRAAAFIAMLKQEAARGSAENPQAFSMGGMAQGYAEGGVVGSDDRTAKAMARLNARQTPKEPLAPVYSPATMAYEDFLSPEEVSAIRAREFMAQMQERGRAEREVPYFRQNSPSRRDASAATNEWAGARAASAPQMSPAPPAGASFTPAQMAAITDRLSWSEETSYPPPNSAGYRWLMGKNFNASDVNAYERGQRRPPASGLDFLKRNGSK